MHILLSDEKLNVTKHDVKFISERMYEMKAVVATSTSHGVVVDKVVEKWISKGWR